MWLLESGDLDPSFSPSLMSLSIYSPRAPLTQPIYTYPGNYFLTNDPPPSHIWIHLHSCRHVFPYLHPCQLPPAAAVKLCCPCVLICISHYVIPEKLERKWQKSVYSYLANGTRYDWLDSCYPGLWTYTKLTIYMFHRPRRPFQFLWIAQRRPGKELEGRQGEVEGWAGEQQRSICKKPSPVIILPYANRIRA